MSDNNTPWPAPTPNESTNRTYGGDAMPVDNSQYAGFWIRFVAHLIDNITIGLIDLPFRLVATALDKNGNTAASILVSIAGFAVSFYAYAYWTGTQGGTPLRCRLGVYIVDQDNGSFIGMRRGVKRVLMSYISGLALAIGFLWTFSNPRRQTWHDIVAKSVVIRR